VNDMLFFTWTKLKPSSKGKVKREEK